MEAKQEKETRTYRDIAFDPDHINTAYAASYMAGRYYHYLTVAMLAEASLKTRNIAFAPRKEYGKRWRALQEAQAEFATIKVQGPERPRKRDAPEQ